MPEPIVVQSQLNASLQRTWDAITDKEQMKVWYFNIPDFDTGTGTVFTFYGGTEDKPYLHICKIIEAIPLKKLSYTWQYENIPIETVVRFELKALAPLETQVTLTHSGVENLPESDPLLNRNNFIAGWNHLIKTSLKDFIEGTKIE